MEGVVFNIQRYSVQDGPGIRTTVFLKGCPLRCQWCHNPESWQGSPQVVWHEERCMECGGCSKVCPQGCGPMQSQLATANGLTCIRCGACVEICPTAASQWIGQRMSLQAVVAEVIKDLIFFEQSGGGVTFSGGEPLLQPEFVLSALKILKKQEIHTAIDTSGYVSPDVLLTVAGQSSLILYDLKHIDNQKHTSITGVPVDPILANLKALNQLTVPVWLRIPLIPGINDDLDTLQQMAQLAKANPCVQQVDVIGYHRTGIAKYGRMGMVYGLDTVAPPTVDHMKTAVELFRSEGVPAYSPGLIS